MSKTDYKYCIGAGAPLCSKCKRHRPYTQANSSECKEWTLVELNAAGFCSMFDPKGGKWISTSNALPPLKTRVLIAEQGAGRTSIRIAKLLGQGQSGVWYWSAQTPTSIITHWQPLPQIPDNE